MADERAFIPVTVWKPDGSQYGEELDEAENVAPVFGDLRSIRKAQSAASTTDSEAPTGAYAHVYQQSRAVQEMRPIASDVPLGRWFDANDATTDDLTFHELLDEESEDTNDRIVGGNDLDSGFYLSFNGTTSQASGGDIFDLDDTASLTVRIRFRTASNAVQALCSRRNAVTAADAGYALLRGGSGSSFNLQCEISDGTTEALAVAGSGLNDGQWHEGWFVIDRSAQTLRVRVDGVTGTSVDISSLGSLSNAQNFLLATLGNGTVDFEGGLDEVPVWTRALTEDEMDARDGRLLDSGDADSLWQMDDGSGGTAADSEGSNDLTLTNTTWEDNRPRFTFDEPDTPAAGDGTMRTYYRIQGVSSSSSLGIAIERDDGAAELDLTGPSAITEDSDWAMHEGTVTSAFLAAVSDLATLKAVYDPDINGDDWNWTPDGIEEAGTWTPSTGTLDSVLAELAGSETASSAVLGIGQTDTFEVSLADPSSDDPYFWPGAYKVRIRHTATNTGVTFDWKLKEGDDVRAEGSGITTTVGYQEETHALTEAEWKSITNWANLSLEITAKHPSAVASTETQSLTPDATIASGGWDGNGSFGHAQVATVDADRAISTDPSAYFSDPSFTVGLSDATDPEIAASHVLRLQSVIEDTNSTGWPYTATLLQGANEKASFTGDFSGVTPANYSHALSDAQANSITNYNDLRIRLSIPRIGSTGSSIQVDQVRLDIPEPRQLTLDYAYLDGPQSGRVEIAFIELELPQPAATSAYTGDVEDIYIGNESKLYVASSSGFTDVSNSTDYPSGYANGTPEPSEWHMTSFGGELVVATNFVDEVQARSANTGEFDNLITSPDPAPKARFVAPFRGHLMLGDINLSGHFADEIWISNTEDATEFDPTVSGSVAQYQRLLSTPGQIMGLVGGDSAIVFKRRSIIAIYWIGGLIVFRPEIVSRSVGTPFPGSIINADSRVYFWDGGSFQVMPAGAEIGSPERIGTDIVSRFLTDGSAADSLENPSLPTMRDEGTLMTSAFDRQTGVCAWMYQNSTGAIRQNSRVLLYNAYEDRWGFVRDAALNGSVLFERGNPALSGSHVLRAIAGAAWTGTDISWFRFDGTSTYAMRIVTKARQVSDDGSLVTITGITPVFTISSGTWPQMTVTIDAATDPRMDVDLQSKSTSTTIANERQIYPIKIGGHWFRFTFDVAELSPEIIQAFRGFYVHFYRGGAR